MATTPADRRYTKEHEWVKLDGDVATVGITEFAQAELGDVTYIEAPEVGKTLGQGDAFGVVESVKAVSDVYAPVAGEVVEVNDALVAQPELVNSSPYEDAWIIKLRVQDASQLDNLLDAKQYEELTASAEH
ncbi:MAG TPA: glycine cleavage system protein GcvH [Thermomicrobiales bacterium]|nr:glycine cleavage system protein GcvH [Thermomicrobiales bacterium]